MNLSVLKVLLISTLMFSCKVQKGVNFINLKTEMDKVVNNEISHLDLNLGCCGYEWVTYLDTNYYDLISTFDGFNHEINPRSDLKLLTNLPYDTVSTKRACNSIIYAIENSKELLVYLESNSHGKDDYKIYNVLFYKGEGLFRVGFAYYVVELLDPKSIGIVQIDYLYG